MKIHINPRVIRHLGKDLITSSDVAIIELVKNSIDAHASTVNLKIYDRLTDDVNIPAIITKAFLSSKDLDIPILVVEDDGIGMTEDTIEKGFLSVGTDIKLSEKDTLGEKGIGRLATQRLGYSVLVETCSSKENYTSYFYINWQEVIEGKTEIPYRTYKSNSSFPHTRLIIFGVNIQDYLENAIQFQQLTLLDGMIKPYMRRDLKTSLNYLVSPFMSISSSIKINAFYQDQEIDLDFDTDILHLAESIHSFEINNNNKEVAIKCSLQIKPWYIERVHLSIVKASAFSRLKQPHEYYQKLLNDNSERIGTALSVAFSQDDLINEICEILTSYYHPFGKKQSEIEQYNDFLHTEAENIVHHVFSILPVFGSVYGFKQGVTVGEKIAIESAVQLKQIDTNTDLGALKAFLSENNGIKLYRGQNRIGFLGNKESDWIRLQQFRTKGQQYYRFDLGNTIGYVSLNDPQQEKIQEISSRLDIADNDYSYALKVCIDFVFNYVFYDLNRKANSIVKVLLDEQGLLGESLKRKIVDNSISVRKIQTHNKKIQAEMVNLMEEFSKAAVIHDTEVILPIKVYSSIQETIQGIHEDIITENQLFDSTAQLVQEAGEQLHAIEVEAYNNYKLMANGMITETITHELDSVCKQNVTPNADKHFDELIKILYQNHLGNTYTQHLRPIRDSYSSISEKIRQVSNMYSFLENTFIHKNAYDVFEQENIGELVDKVNNNLKQAMKINDIAVVHQLNDLEWLVPKGVMLHVMYNLFANSYYWIDVRRKRAQFDYSYAITEQDKIIIEMIDQNAIVVSDTGTGVIPSMEDILFEPLESGKPAKDRRGMGLYIVQKLMQSFGGNIRLLDDRNAFGNRFRFLLLLKVED